MTLEDIRRECQSDAEMVEIQDYLQGRSNAIPEQFCMVADELSQVDGVILRGDRLVVPRNLRNRTVALAHASHQGIVKTKALVRETMWFPGIDRMVEEEVKSCIACHAS